VVHHDRHDWETRLRTRYGYGHGVGAFCAIRLRRRDRRWARILTVWLAWQGGELLRALARRDRAHAHERARSLQGTAAGLLYGLRVPRWPLAAAEELS
jgi:hypothetical protein